MDNPGIFYTEYDSPLGTLYIASSDKGITDVMIAGSEAAFVERIAERFSKSPMADKARFDKVKKELDLYFRGVLKTFSGPLDLRGTAFELAVWIAIDRIEWGKTQSYGTIANSIDKPKAARAVGSACGRNPIPIIIPCHRVLREDGSIGGYTGGLGIKRKLLDIEGIALIK